MRESADYLRVVIPIEANGWHRLLFWRRYFLYADTQDDMADVEIRKHLDGRVHWEFDALKPDKGYKLCFCWVLPKDEILFLRAMEEYEHRIEQYHPEVIGAIKDVLGDFYEKVKV